MKTLAWKIQTLGTGFAITASGGRDLWRPGSGDEQGRGEVLKIDHDGSLSSRWRIKKIGNDRDFTGSALVRRVSSSIVKIIKR